MRGSRASQSETAILPSEFGSGGSVFCCSISRPAAVEPLRHGLGREAEPAMGVLVAQELEIVRREIDHQQPPGRPQHPRRLLDRARAVVEEVQHLVDDDDDRRNPAAARDRRCRPGARCNGASPARSSRARAMRQHVEREIEAEPALDLGAEQFEHAAGAGAEIEQRAERRAGERRADRRLDRLVGDVQLADAVPLGGMAAEIGLRGGGARGPHGGQPLAVARDGRIAGIEPRDQLARELGAAAVLAEAEEGPGAFAEPLDQAGLGQQLEMARDARLRLAQDVGEIGDRQLGLGEQRQDAQPRRLAGRLEGAVERHERQLGNLTGRWRQGFMGTGSLDTPDHI